MLIIINNSESTVMPKDHLGRSLTWNVHDGFFGPDGLVRRELPAATRTMSNCPANTISITLTQSASLTPSGSRGGHGIVGLCLGDILPDPVGSPAEELVVATLSGDLVVMDAATLAERWRACVPGAVGMFNSMRIADLNGDQSPELYVAGSFGMWRFAVGIDQ